jgi:hypothetical protein
MSQRVYFDVDPATLRLPNERRDGADPAKLQRQIARHGRSLIGMPPVLVYRGSDGELVIPAELLGQLPHLVGHLTTVQEKLP